MDFENVRALNQTRTNFRLGTITNFITWYLREKLGPSFIFDMICSSHKPHTLDLVWILTLALHGLSSFDLHARHGITILSRRYAGGHEQDALSWPCRSAGKAVRLIASEGYTAEPQSHRADLGRDNTLLLIIDRSDLSRTLHVGSGASA